MEAPLLRDSAVVKIIAAGAFEAAQREKDFATKADLLFGLQTKLDHALEQDKEKIKAAEEELLKPVEAKMYKQLDKVWKWGAALGAIAGAALVATVLFPPAAAAGLVGGGFLFGGACLLGAAGGGILAGIGSGLLHLAVVAETAYSDVHYKADQALRSIKERKQGLEKKINLELAGLEENLSSQPHAVRSEFRSAFQHAAAKKALAAQARHQTTMERNADETAGAAKAVAAIVTISAIGNALRR